MGLVNISFVPALSFSVFLLLPLFLSFLSSTSSSVAFLPSSGRV